MSLLRRIDEDLKVSLKGADKLRLSVLRLLKAAVKNRQIDKGGELTDEEILSIISTLAKQRRESIEQFSKGGRQDLVDSETLELSILCSYLPAQLTAEELDVLIAEAIRDSSAQTEADMGKVMRVLMPRLKGRADGKMVNERVKNLLRAGGG